MTDLGLRITLLRTSRRLSQRQLSRLLKISRPWLGEIETNRRPPSDSLVNTIEDFFNFKLNDPALTRLVESVPCEPNEPAR